MALIGFLAAPGDGIMRVSVSTLLCARQVGIRALMTSGSSNLMARACGNLTALPACALLSSSAHHTTYGASSSPHHALQSSRPHHPTQSSGSASGLPTKARAPPAERTGQEQGVEHTAREEWDERRPSGTTRNTLAQNTRDTMARVVPPDCRGAAEPGKTSAAGRAWLLQKWKSQCSLLDDSGDDPAPQLHETHGSPRHETHGSPRAAGSPQTLEASNMGEGSQRGFVVVIRLTHLVLQAPAWAQFIKSCPGDGVPMTRGCKGQGDEEAGDAHGDGDADGGQDPLADSGREPDAACLEPAPSCTNSACRDLARHFYAALSRALSDTPSQARPLGDEGLAWRCTGWELVTADIAVVNMRLLSRRHTVGKDQEWLASRLQEHLDARLKAARATCHMSMSATCHMVLHTHRPCAALALSLRADSYALDASQAPPNKGTRAGGHRVADTQECDMADTRPFFLESERERQLQQFRQNVSSHPLLHTGDRSARRNVENDQEYHEESDDDVFSSRSVAGQFAPGQDVFEALKCAVSAEHSGSTLVGALHAAAGDAGNKQRAESAITATRKHGDKRAAKSEMYMESMSQIDADDMAALPPEIQAELRLLPKHRPGRRNGKGGAPARPLARLYKGACNPSSGPPRGVGSRAPAPGAQGEGQSSAPGIDSAVVLELEKQMGVRASSLVQSCAPCNQDR